MSVSNSVNRKTLGKNSLLGINTGSAHSAGPGALVAVNDEGFTFFVLGRRRVHSSPFVRGCHIACFVLGRRRVHIFRRRAPKGSHFRPRAPKGSRLSSSGAGGFVFLILGRRRVRIFRPWAPKGSHFWFLCAEGFTLLVLVCRRVRIFRTRVAQAPEGSIFLPGDQENLMFEKCVFLTWFQIKNAIFGCWPL